MSIRKCHKVSPNLMWMMDDVADIANIRQDLRRVNTVCWEICDSGMI